jgi:hypothetical protein
MKPIEDILKETLSDISSKNYSPFSKQGFEEYKVQISKFIIRLYDESIRNSKRNNSDIITMTHISDAVNYISNINKFRFSNLLNTVGGIFIGSTLTFLLSVISTNVNYSSEMVIVYILIGIVGSFILGYNLSKE